MKLPSKYKVTEEGQRKSRDQSAGIICAMESTVALQCACFECGAVGVLEYT